MRVVKQEVRHLHISLLFCLSVCLSRHSTAAVLRRAAGLLLSAVWVGDIDRQRRAPSSSGAAARRSAAIAGTAMLTVEMTRLRLNTDLLKTVRQV